MTDYKPEDFQEAREELGQLDGNEKAYMYFNRGILDEALRRCASPTVTVPEGWKMVPIEPTEKMIEETKPLWGTFPTGVPMYGNPHGILNLWRTMIAAAPQHTGGADEN